MATADEVNNIIGQLEQKVDLLIQERDQARANQGVPQANLDSIGGHLQSLLEKVTAATQ